MNEVYNNLIDAALHSAGIFLEPNELKDIYLIAPLLATGYISGQIPDIQAFDNGEQISSTSTKEVLLEYLLSSGLVKWKNDDMLWMTEECIERYKEPLVAISKEGWKRRTSDPIWLRKFGKTDSIDEINIYTKLMGTHNVKSREPIEDQVVSTNKI